MRLRIRVSLRLVDLEVGQLQSLVFQAVVGAVGLVVHPASQAAVDAELVADVRGAFPPEVDIFEDWSARTLPSLMRVSLMRNVPWWV